MSDSQFLASYNSPQLQGLLPVLYPGVFPNLAAYAELPTTTRPDLVAILLTGIPSGIITGLPELHGHDQADELRLNVAIPPAITTTNPAANLLQQPRPARRRRVRVPERTQGLRQRHRDRAAGDRRCDPAARGHQVHRGRCGWPADRRDDKPSAVPQQLPVPRAPLLRATWPTRRRRCRTRSAMGAGANRSSALPLFSGLQLRVDARWERSGLSIGLSRRREGEGRTDLCGHRRRNHRWVSSCRLLSDGSRSS